MKPNSKAEESIDWDKLNNLLSYDPDSGVFLISKSRGGCKAGRIAGLLRKDGYIQIKINGRAFLAHRLAWFFVHKKWPDNGMDIDHINRNKSDNRISNLRLGTRLQNCGNGNVKQNNKSGAAGVFWLVRKDGRAPRWMAYITIKGKRKRLGLFVNKEDAMAARRAAEKYYHQDFAPK